MRVEVRVGRSLVTGLTLLGSEEGWSRTMGKEYGEGWRVGGGVGKLLFPAPPSPVSWLGQKSARVLDKCQTELWKGQGQETTQLLIRE